MEESQWNLSTVSIPEINNGSKSLVLCVITQTIQPSHWSCFQAVSFCKACLHQLLQACCTNCFRLYLGCFLMSRGGLPYCRSFLSFTQIQWYLMDSYSMSLLEMSALPKLYKDFQNIIKINKNISKLSGIACKFFKVFQHFFLENHYTECNRNICIHNSFFSEHVLVIEMQLIFESLNGLKFFFPCRVAR